MIKTTGNLNNPVGRIVSVSPTSPFVVTKPDSAQGLTWYVRSLTSVGRP